jgi:DNA-binding MarR family transcriptional regulator
MRDAAKELTNRIVASGGALLRLAGELFRPHGITAAQFNVLNLLVGAPEGMRPSELAGQLVVDPSSTTYLVDQMEAKGWLKRTDDRADRRAWRVVVTVAGRKMHQRVEPDYVAALREMMRGLGAADLPALTKTLTEIQAAADAAVHRVLASRPAKRRLPRSGVVPP